MSGHGCVGGGGRCRFPHQESAGRSRRCGPVDPSHWAYSSNLLGKKNTKTHETLKKRGKNDGEDTFFSTITAQSNKAKDSPSTTCSDLLSSTHFKVDVNYFHLAISKLLSVNCLNHLQALVCHPQLASYSITQAQPLLWILSSRNMFYTSQYHQRNYTGLLNPSPFYTAGIAARIRKRMSLCGGYLSARIMYQ